MGAIIYKYINYKEKEFKEVINLRYDLLFKPYNKIDKYDYDELDPISFHLIVLDEEKLVAYSRITNINGKGKITNVVVSKDYKNMGIGFKMIRLHIEKAKENNIRFVYLNSRLDTINFYKKSGFKCSENKILSERSGLVLQKMYINIL